MKEKINLGCKEIEITVFYAGQLALTTLKDSAEVLGVHPNTVRNWANEGVLSVHKLPTGVRRYPLESIINIHGLLHDHVQE
ncbi:MAG TPA: helix-turn-helix domain-containing protein [Candidatus Saccharimonadales bacterium]|nr:helix-turn-helix domain-containing protein [Candidatus Saccharimonadales bacterium]